MATQGGVFVAFDPARREEPVIETTAEKALWHTIGKGMDVVFWPHGVSLAEAISAGVRKPPAQPRTKKPKAGDA